MELLASVVLVVGLSLSLLEVGQNYYISTLAELLLGSLMCAVFYDSFFRLIPSGTKTGQFRGILGTGLCYIYLVPTAFLLSHQDKVRTEPGLVKLSVLLIFVPVMSQLIFTAWYCDSSLAMRCLLCISIVPWIVLLVFGSSHCTNYIREDIAAGITTTTPFDFLLCGVGIMAQYFIYRYASDSFSIQEGTILSQGLVLFVHQTWRPLFTSLWNYYQTKDVTVVKHLVKFEIPKIELFSEVAVTSGMMVLSIIFFCRLLRNTFGFYTVTFAIMALFSYPVLYLAFDDNFASWMYGYVQGTSERRQLFVYWAVICGISVITVAVTILYQGTDNMKACQQEIRTNELLKQSGKVLAGNKEIGMKKLMAGTINLRQRCGRGDNVNMNANRQENVIKSVYNTSGITTVTRKVFHIIAISAFLPGIHYDRTILNCACSCALVIFTFLECMRLMKVWPVGSILDHYLNMFRDRQDQGALILTPIYLLVGFSIPVWLHQGRVTSVSLFSGVLSLGVGDSAASYIGSKFGKIKWPHGFKTVEGTMASMVAMIWCSSVLHYCGICVVVSPVQLVIAVVLTSLFEAFTTQIDNLVLPLFMYCLLMQ